MSSKDLMLSTQAIQLDQISKSNTRIKTNIILPGQGATYGGGSFISPQPGIGSTDQYAPKWLIPHIETLIGTFREAVGDDIDINLDLNFHFKTEALSLIHI